MPLGPVYKANSPKNVPQLPLSDRFPSSGREVRFKESPDHMHSPYSTDLNTMAAPSSSSGSKKMNAGQWVKVDDGNGNQYLLNLVTQESKWPSPIKGSSSQRNSVQWQLLYDAEGNPYYYDESTDQVQWENPWAGGSGGEATTSSSAALASLPSGWEAAVDPNTSLKYYFNNQTNESQWTTPQKDMSLSPFRQQEPPQSPAWASAVDPETGAPYYYSSQGETQWNTPAKLKAQRGGSSFLPPKDSPGSPYHSGRKHMAPEAEASLPSGWESAVDPETGASYYYNSITLESRWLPPKSSSSSSGAGAGAGAGAGSGRSSKSSARQKLKGLFSEAYFQGLETVPEGDSSSSPRVGQEGVRGAASAPPPFGAEVVMTRKPSPRASGDMIEFLESKEETQVRKFERMKGSASLLRQLVYGEEEWSEWQMPGGGAVFYSQVGVRGGQWQKPIVFENAAAMARSSGGSGGDVAPGLDPQADRERIEASRLKMDKARLARSFEYGFDAPASGAAVAGEPDPREAAAERARAGLEMIRKKEQREREEEAPVFDVEDEDEDGRVNRSGSALAQRVKAVVTGKIEKNVQQEAYRTLRMRDAAVEQDLQLADVQKRADRAKERWKEFVGPTFSHNDEDVSAPKKAASRDEDSDYESENDDEDEEEGGGITVKKGSKRRTGARAGAPRARTAAGSKSQSVDFDALYARAIVVRQKWPWTCLVDMKSDRLFYRNEVQDSFQLEAPPEFESQRDRDDRLPRGRSEREDEKEEEDFDRFDKPEIHAGETAADFVTRFKDELKARRDHLVAKKTRDRVVLTTAGQEKALGATEADEGYEKKTRGKSLSASSIVNKIRSFSLANQVLEAAGAAKAVIRSNNRNLFARWHGAPGQAASREALARKYAQPKAAYQKGGLITVSSFSILMQTPLRSPSLSLSLSLSLSTSLSLSLHLSHPRPSTSLSPSLSQTAGPVVRPRRRCRAWERSRPKPLPRALRVPPRQGRRRAARASAPSRLRATGPLHRLSRKGRV